MVGLYENLLGTCALELPGIDLPTVRDGPTLSTEAKKLLSEPISVPEIDRALWSIDDSKAPALGGFNALFFKKCWQFIKQDIYDAVNEFFQKAYLHGPVNLTVVTLVPKKADARYAKDCRPIACCSTLYKIISKVIIHRLHKVIGEVINQSQSGFILGRHIADNIILATELIRGYGRAHISPRCVIKVDIRKAYDSVE